MARDRESARSAVAGGRDPLPAESAAWHLRWRRNAQTLLALLALMLLLEVIDWATSANLDQYGVHPRELRGIWGIVAAPFLHGGFYHLLANAVPFFVLGWLILLRGWRDFAAVSIVAGLVSGGVVWILGAQGTVHIGASGVVFGYFGFLVARGLVDPGKDTWEASSAACCAATSWPGPAAAREENSCWAAGTGENSLTGITGSPAPGRNQTTHLLTTHSPPPCLPARRLSRR